MRGLAVAGVLFFHGGHLAGGFLGVDAFFVLSGFLITSLLLAEAGARGRIALGAFWMRRARRLLPALVCVLAAVAVYAQVLAKPEELATIRGDALATIGYFANWRAIFTSTDYWALFRSPSPLIHTWSLAIEEQFYLVWPLLVAVIVRGCSGRTAAKRLLVTSAALAIASLAWMLVIFDPANPSRVYYGTDTRLASILVGAAFAAWLAVRGPVRGPRARVALEVVAVAALVVLATAFARASGSSDVLYRGGLFACAVAVGLVIAAAVHPRSGPVSRVLSFRPFCALGLVSYGVYLWHWPIYVVINEARAHLTGWPLLALRIGVTLVIAAVSYRFVEKPIRRHAGSRPTARRFTVAVATVAALVSAIMVTTTTAPAPPRLVADRIRPPMAMTRTQATTAPGVKAVKAATAAKQTVRIPRVLVVGNSVALYTGDEGFKRLRTTPRLDVLNLGSIGCRLLPEETRSRFPSGDMYESQTGVCRDRWAFAVSVFRPDVAVLLVSDPADALHEINGRWTHPCEREYDDVFEREMHDQIRLLASKGARVVVTTTAYAGFPYKSLSWFRNNDCQNAMLRRVVASEPSAVMADLFQWMCPHLDSDCRSHLAATVLRPDGVHFRDASARAVAAWLIAQAQQHGVLAGVRVDAPDARLAATRPSG
ncbi:MAG TPA: acyltransferase [Acidimicrobiia bacterium]|nr:acyltransferase [Acidimicrobiia bacterium]